MFDTWDIASEIYPLFGKYCMRIVWQRLWNARIGKIYGGKGHLISWTPIIYPVKINFGKNNFF